jgi:hypothetical protein
MLPTSTLNNWGNSSSLYFLKKLPEREIDAIFLDAMGLRLLSPGYIVLILQTWMMRPWRPMRFCMKKPLLRVSSAATTQHINMTGASNSSPARDAATSNVRFNTMSVFDIQLT